MILNHVHLGTRNLGLSVEFYQSVFGFKKKFDDGADADFDGNKIAISWHLE